jgi:calcineurin-like phosphoesterase family protein
MDCRGFTSVEEMHQYIIERWNNKVRKNDEVMILGDLSYGKAEETNQLLEQLNGKLFLIKGNHDYFLKDKRFNSKRFQWIESYKEVKDDGRKVILSHYPIVCYNGQYRKNKKGQAKTYMLYGHVHNSFDEILVNQFQNEMRACKRELLGVEGLENIP